METPMKLIAATVASLSLMMPALAQADTKSRPDVRSVAPALEKYTQGTLADL
jgi:hypothetical protein